MIGEGLLAWGSQPIEPFSDHYSELYVVRDMPSAARESGIDNSTMWEEAAFNKDRNMMELADVGLTSLSIVDCEALADMADVIGRTAESSELRERAGVCKKILRDSGARRRAPTSTGTATPAQRTVESLRVFLQPAGAQG